MNVNSNQINAEPGYQIYSERTLWIYDFLVHQLSNHFVWRCPTRYLNQVYASNVRNEHLEIGVGTGLFLDRLNRQIQFNKLVLADANQNCLQKSLARLKRFCPTAINVNLCDSDPFSKMPDNSFSSIGLNYVLHCLPQGIANLPQILESLQSKMKPGCVLFGSTILGANYRTPWLPARLMRYYQKLGIFDNQLDSLDKLTACFQQYFENINIKKRGSVAIFVAHQED